MNRNKMRFRDLTKKYVLIALAAAAVLSSFSGEHDIEDRLLVHAIGIDRSSDGYEVSFQVFRSSGSGSDIPIDTSLSNVQLINVSAPTVSEAIEKCSSELGREAFLGHLQMICLGRDVTIGDPKELFSFAVKDRSVYLGVELCQADAKARDVIMTELKRGTVSSENLVRSIDENVKKGRTVRCTLLSFLSCIDSPQFQAMPVVGIGQQGSGKNKEPVIEVSGTALYADGESLPGRLSPEESYGLSLLCEKAESLHCVVGKTDVKFENADTERKLRYENGELVFDVQISLTAAVSLDIKGSSPVSERELEEHIGRLVMTAWEKSEGTGCDAVGVWRLMRQRYPEMYLENKDGMAELVKSVTPRISIGCEME